jgi:hypothetical protein
MITRNLKYSLPMVMLFSLATMTFSLQAQEGGWKTTRLPCSVCMPSRRNLP